jgi:hypothetical protein
VEWWGLIEGLLSIVPAAVKAARELIPGGEMLDQLDSVRRANARLDELQAARADPAGGLAVLAQSDEDVLIAVHGTMEVLTVLLAVVIERRAAERRCADADHDHDSPTPPLVQHRAPRLPRGPAGPRKAK